MLWESGIASCVCLGAAYLFRDHPAVMVILVVVGALPVIVTCGGFVYFARTKPELLQSEDYQLRHEALQMIQKQSGHAGVIDVSDVTAIANPALAALRPEQKTEESKPDEGDE